MVSLIAFLIQAILMLGHLHGAVDVEVNFHCRFQLYLLFYSTIFIFKYHMHYLWTIVITLNFFSALAEAYDPDNFWFIYSRIFFFVVQG